LAKPLGRISRLVGKLTLGIIPDFKASRASDEIGELERKLETHVTNLKEIAAFSRSIGKGDFTGKYEKLSGEDELGDALSKLKISLMKSMEEEESRRREEEERTWTAQGLAKFSTLFREVEDNLQELSNLLMKELVAYTDADAGALFVSMDKEQGEAPCLEISGSYAFDRKKQIHRSFQFGEGLVGRAALEKELIYLTDLPAEYIKIRSGLGEDKPSSLLLVPVVLDRQVLGVMELASLGEIPSHQIEFVRQLADALATTLARVKANLQIEQAIEHSQHKEAKLLEEINKLRKGMS
jgi:transcriptional regulator with GAF, ATPase, and Fis domain